MNAKIKKDFLRLRRGSTRFDTELTSQASEFLASIPAYAKPEQLASMFPRILNHIAAVRTQPQVLADYFASLILDSRGDRKGFPPHVLREILDLQDYYDRTPGAVR